MNQRLLPHTILRALLAGAFFPLLALPMVDEAAAAQPEPQERRLWMTVGDQRFSMTAADTAAARTFAGQLPLTLDMPDLNANEKHVTLPEPLPADASRPGTIRHGDVMLYGTQTLVVFYKTFASSYAYTRLGRVDDADRLVRALGNGTVRIRFSRD